MIFDKLFNKTQVPVLEKVMAFTEQRHKVLAHNIANASTPFYRRRDLDVEAFTKQLRGAIEQREMPGHSRRWEFDTSFTVGTDEAGFLRAKVERDRPSPGVMRHDRNTVDVQHEMAQLARNTMLHNAASELLRKQYDMLRTAISERVG